MVKLATQSDVKIRVRCFIEHFFRTRALGIWSPYL